MLLDGAALAGCRGAQRRRGVDRGDADLGATQVKDGHETGQGGLALRGEEGQGQQDGGQTRGGPAQPEAAWSFRHGRAADPAHDPLLQRGIYRTQQRWQAGQLLGSVQQAGVDGIRGCGLAAWMGLARLAPEAVDQAVDGCGDLLGVVLFGAACSHLCLCGMRTLPSQNAMHRKSG